jgi:hypothetical protein
MSAPDPLEVAVVPPAPAQGAVPSPPAAVLGPAFGWNVAVIVIGTLIAAGGLVAGLFADPEDSALRQTVAALWVIQGLLGLIIAAVGVLGASLVHTLRRSPIPLGDL